MDEIYWGYSYTNEIMTERVRLEEKSALIAFIKSHLYDEQLVITDSMDKLIFRSVDGIDLYSGLSEIGIDLPLIHQELRHEWRGGDEKEENDRETWEKDYDIIGLSPGEILMRQRVKQECKAARSVGDVAALLKDTYFDAFLISEDKNLAWGYFNEDDCSVYIFDGSEEEGWGNKRDEMIFLDRDARVKHISSSEDQHWFLILDPPEDRR